MKDLPPCKTVEDICIRLACIESLIAWLSEYIDPPVALIGKLTGEKYQLEAQLPLEESYEAVK